jgi:hypothetical protein
MHSSDHHGHNRTEDPPLEPRTLMHRKGRAYLELLHILALEGLAMEVHLA